MSAYLEDYFSMASERKKLGIEPLALTEAQTKAVCELLKQPPLDSNQDFLYLLKYRVNPGVDKSSKIKADFLYDLACGRSISPLIDKKAAVEMLGQMRGGYNVSYLIALLDNADLALEAQHALEQTLLVYSAFDDVLAKANQGNVYAKAVIDSWAQAKWFTSAPKFPESITLKVFKVAAALQLTAKGQAVIYYGEEIGQHGLNNYPIQSNRYDFDWNQVDTQSADANSMLNHYEKLLSIRTEYKKLFARGDRSSVLASDDDGYDVFTRSYNGTKLYVGLNIKDADQTISIPVSEAAGSTMTDLYSGKIYTVSTDGKVEITIPKAVDGGTVILKKETSSNGGSSSSTGTTETVKNDTTTVTNPDGSKTETTVIKDLPADTKASLNVTTDANGNKTSEAAVETKGTEKKSGVSTSVSADVVKAITDKAKTTDVTIKQEVKKADGSTAYTVEVSAGDVKAGETLKLLKKDAKTGELVLVNKKDYTVSADGSVDLTIKNSGEYVLLNSKDAKAAVKEIKKTVKATKTSTNVKKKKTTKFPWSKKLNMENVDKITYTSSKKSVVTVNKNGKITAKKKGTAKVKAVVTLKDGTKKTVTMKVKVK
mgnify:CR=1 FL=1